ncbi:MAG: hypothetical protein ACOC56_04685 [Atribacterota bacterium]
MNSIQFIYNIENNGGNFKEAVKKLSDDKKEGLKIDLEERLELAEEEGQVHLVDEIKNYLYKLEEN